MIPDFLLGVVAFMLNGVASILPSITIFPTTLATQINTFVSYINGWSWLFPINTLFAVIGIMIALVAVEFLYFSTMFILNLIHRTLRG